MQIYLRDIPSEANPTRAVRRKKRTHADRRDISSTKDQIKKKNILRPPEELFFLVFLIDVVCMKKVHNLVAPQ